MALEGCSACLKYFMIIWNFIILILGIAIVGVGVWLVVDKDSGQFVDETLGEINDDFIINYSRVSDPSFFETLSYLLIAFGAVVVIIAFLGYCGAMRESQVLLAACFVCLFIIFGVLVGVGIWAYIEKDDVDIDQERLYPVVKSMVDDAVKQYSKDAASKDFMDTLQDKFECCGGSNAALDYANTGGPPDSCAMLYLTKGCVDPYFMHVRKHIGVKEWFGTKLTIAMAVALGVAGSLIVAMILTLCLCCAVRRSGSY